MEIGRAYMNLGDYPAALVAFEQVMTQHPASEWADAAVYEAGRADLQTTEFSNDNEQLLARARHAFEMYLAQAPTGPFADAARTRLRECDEMQAANLWRLVAFYDRRHQPRAAAMTARSLVRQHPDSALAARAGTLVQEYEKQGVQLP